MEQTEITARLDTADLAEAWAEKKGRKPDLYLDIRFGARTDLGRIRENNEDKFDFVQPEETEFLAVKGSLFAVADGMGGHACGQIASELALKTVIKTYYSDPDEDAARSLSAALRAANSYIYDTARTIPDRAGMGTTCTVLVLRQGEMFIAHVGDSRAYLVREGEIRQISIDHSLVGEQVRLGVITAEDAAASPFRNVITRSLGAESDVEVNVYLETARRGDALVLCSDGLTGFVTDAEILELVKEWSPSLAAMKLVDKANENGGSDNITAAVVRIQEIQKSPGRLKRLFGRG